ncbi:membrane protein [Deltaproteobacteria bacterium]|nr:membrane protein [Deltaproteobacteria bacterium]
MWLLAASPAWAHRPGLSYARIGDDALALTFARPELAGALPAGGELEASRLLVGELLLEGTSLKVNDQACEFGDPTLRSVEGDGVELTVSLDCPHGERMYEAGFFPRMEAGHRHYVEAEGAAVAVLDAAHTSVAIVGTPDPWTVAARFGALGVEHIWTGYDHLLFLFGLLLAAKGLRAMLLVVTGFTVAHSITLSLAALGWVHLAPAVVEPAIAASIVFVGVENLWKPTAARRAVVTFALGLVHGFGFAGMLLELGLPRSALVAALVSFNGGVELGQAAIVALILPLLLLLRRAPWWERRAVPLLSAGVALAGLVWFVERVWA